MPNDDQILADIHRQLGELTSLPVQVGALQTRVSELREMLKESSTVARADREEIKAALRLQNGRVRDVELEQAKHAGGISTLWRLVGVVLAAPAIILAIIGVVVATR